MNKTFSIVFTGPEQIIDASIDAFVFCHGYTDGHELTKTEYARAILRQYVVTSIEQYYKQQAIKAVAEATAAQVGGSVGMVTMTVALS